MNGLQEQSMLRKLIQAGAVLALFSSPACAQTSLGVPIHPKRLLTPEEIEQQKAADQAYDAAMRKIPDKRPSADPWGTIRPNSAPGSKNMQQ